MVSYHAIILYAFIPYVIVDILREIETQSGFLRLIDYLNDNGESMLTQIRDDRAIPIHQLYDSIEMAKKLKLIKTRIDNAKYPPRNLISITEKGRELAVKIKEIIDILKSSE